MSVCVFCCVSTVKSLIQMAIEYLIFPQNTKIKTSDLFTPNQVPEGLLLFFFRWCTKQTSFKYGQTPKWISVTRINYIFYFLWHCVTENASHNHQELFNGRFLFNSKFITTKIEYKLWVFSHRTFYSYFFC